MYSAAHDAHGAHLSSLSALASTAPSTDALYSYGPGVDAFTSSHMLIHFSFVESGKRRSLSSQLFQPPGFARRFGAQSS